MKKPDFRLLILAMILASLIIPLVAAAQNTSTTTAASTEPKRIAVIPLKTGAGVASFWQGGFNPGAAMTDILTNRLASANRFLVFDRAHLNDILREQDLGSSGRFSPETAVQVGKLAGVQYVVVGTVTEFYQVRQNDGLGVAVPLPFGTAVKMGSKRVRTGVELQVIDVTTGLISSAISVRDEAVVGDFGFGGYYKGIGIGYYNNEFLNSALGKSMVRLADAATRKIETAEFKELPAFKMIEGYVLYVDGEQVYLSLGKKDGVVEGMVFSITRPMTITDPVTNEERTITKNIADIKITDVEEGTCTGTTHNKKDTVLLKDKVRRKK